MAEEYSGHRAEGDASSHLSWLNEAGILAEVASPIYVFDEAAAFCYANPSGLQILGVSADEIIGKTWQAIGISSKGELSLEMAIQQVIASGDPLTAEAIRQGSEGVRRSFEFRLNPLRDTEGKVRAVVATVTDTTQRRQAELRWSSFFTEAPVGLYWVATDGQIIRANPAVLQMLGYEEPELAGQHIAAFYADQAVVEDILERWRQGETIRDHEVRLRCKDGTIIYGLLSAAVAMRNGKFYQARCFLRDITERIHAEERLRYFASNVRGIFWQGEVVIRGGGHMDWKTELLVDAESAQRFLPLHVLLGSNYMQAFWSNRPEEDQIRVAIHARQMVREGKSYGQDFRCYSLDGERWLREEVNVEEQSPGHFRLFGVCWDITERKLAEEELRRVTESARCILWYADVFANEDRSLRWELRVKNEDTARGIIPVQVPSDLTFVEAWYMTRPDSVRREMDARAREAIWSGLDSYSQEFPCILPAGTVWLYEKVKVTPVGPGQWRAIGVCMDVTERKEFYHAVIYGVTQGKLRLCAREQMKIEGEHVLRAILSDSQDVAKIREQLGVIAANVGITGEALDGLLLATGEACTNALVHGVFKRRETVSHEEREAVHGRCEVFLTDDRALIRVVDPGFGIPIFKDPGTVLQRGRSTIISMGMGFTLMRELVTSMSIASDDSGTWVQLEFWRKPESHTLDEMEMLMKRMAS